MIPEANIISRKASVASPKRAGESEPGVEPPKKIFRLERASRLA